MGGFDLSLKQQPCNHSLGQLKNKSTNSQTFFQVKINPDCFGIVVLLYNTIPFVLFNLNSQKLTQVCSFLVSNNQK